MRTAWKPEVWLEIDVSEYRVIINTITKMLTNTKKTPESMSFIDFIEYT